MALDASNSSNLEQLALKGLTTSTRIFAATDSDSSKPVFAALADKVTNPKMVYTRVQVSCSISDQWVSLPGVFWRHFTPTSLLRFAKIYQAGSLTPEITLILFIPSIAQLADIYRG